MTKKQTVGAMAGIITVGVLVLVLVYLALDKTRAEIPAAGETPGYLPTLQSGQSEQMVTEPPQDPPPETPPPAQPDPAVAPATRLLAAADSLLAYRAFTGVCASPTSIEISTDGGFTWNPADTTGTTPLGNLQRLIPGVDGYVAAVGQPTDDCSTITGMESFTFGNAWQDSASVAEQSWFVNPANPSELHPVGGNAVPIPCPVARLSAAGGDRVAALCTDGALISSTDAGVTWTQTEPIPGVDAIESGVETTRVAILDSPSCDGTLIRSFTPSLEVSGEICAPVQSTPGTTALSESADGALWLWAGDAVLHSADGGATWQ